MKEAAHHGDELGAARWLMGRRINDVEVDVTALGVCYRCYSC